MLPVRCYTCNRVLGHLGNIWTRLCREMSAKEALDQLGLRRECCRMRLLTHVDLVEATLDYDRANRVKAPNDSSMDHIKIHLPKPSPPSSLDGTRPSKKRRIEAI